MKPRPRRLRAMVSAARRLRRSRRRGPRRHEAAAAAVTGHGMRGDGERWVDVHVHHLPGALVEAYGRRRDVPCLAGGLVDMGGGLAYPLFPDMVDASRRLELMDADGIAVSVL